MKTVFQRRQWLQHGLALGATLWLPQARACEFFTRTLRITHPWTRASAPGATSAMVSMAFDEVLQADRLIAARTPVAARAAMGGPNAKGKVDFAIAAGRDTQLAESGTHLLLLDLQHPLEMAREYPLTLVFEKGGVVNASLSVDYAAARSAPAGTAP